MRMAPRVALRAALLLLHVSTLFSKSQAGDAVTYTEAERAQRGLPLQTLQTLRRVAQAANARAELVRSRGIKHCDSPGSFSVDPACPLCWGPLELARSPGSEPDTVSRLPAAPGSGSSKVRLLGRCLPKDTARAVGVMMAHWERTVRLTVAQA